MVFLLSPYLHICIHVGLSLTVYIKYLHPVCLMAVCISQTDVPDTQFSIPFIHLNESEFFYFADFTFGHVLLSGLFSLLVLFCVFRSVWFLDFSFAFTFL